LKISGSENMKTSILKSTIAVLIIVASFAACNKSNDNPDFTGNYIIGSVTLAGPLVVPTAESGDITVPIGTDITSLIRNDLLGTETCSTPENVNIELRNDFSLYLSCQGYYPVNAGTWEEVSSTALNLNLSPQVVPSSPAGVTLYVTGIIKDQTGLAGKAGLLLPKEQISQIIEPMQLTLGESAPAVFVVNFIVQFASK
jgi:hypothetical protein